MTQLIDVILHFIKIKMIESRFLLPELRKEDPYLDGSPTEKVPM